MQTSGKVWKIGSDRATAYKQPVLGSSWEKKMKDKAARKAFQDLKTAAVDAVKEKKKVGSWACHLLLLLLQRCSQMERPVRRA